MTTPKLLWAVVGILGTFLVSLSMFIMGAVRDNERSIGLLAIEIAGLRERSSQIEFLAQTARAEQAGRAQEQVSRTERLAALSERISVLGSRIAALETLRQKIIGPEAESDGP